MSSLLGLLLFIITTKQVSPFRNLFGHHQIYFTSSISNHHDKNTKQQRLYATTTTNNNRNRDKRKNIPNLVEDVITSFPIESLNFSAVENKNSDKLVFPDLEESGLDEKALRNSPIGKILFGVIDVLFPVFKEPNWFDVYDPPLTAAENLGKSFINLFIYFKHSLCLTLLFSSLLDYSHINKLRFTLL